MKKPSAFLWTCIKTGVFSNKNTGAQKLHIYWLPFAENPVDGTSALPYMYETSFICYMKYIDTHSNMCYAVF